MEQKKKKPQNKEENPHNMLLGLGIAFIVMATIHWAFPILGILLLIGWGWLMYDKAKKKQEREEKKHESKIYAVDNNLSITVDDDDAWVRHLQHGH